MGEDFPDRQIFEEVFDKQGLKEALKLTPNVVLRHSPKVYPYFLEIDIEREGRWHKRTDVLGIHVDRINNLHATNRFEFDDNGTWAQVYEIREV